MSTPLFQIRRYLASPDPGFWRWDGDGEAVLWSDGSVLAFRKEIIEVLDELSFEGLPLLSAVLLVMAASRSNWGTGQRAAQALTVLTRQFDDAGHKLSLPFLSDVMAGLQRVHEARGELAYDPYALANVAALILSDVERVVDADRAKDIVAALRAGPGEEIFDAYRGSETYDDFLSCLNVLRERLCDVSADTLRARARTGLDRPVESPADAIELEALPLRARALIEQLRHDEEYAPVARLARALMAAIHLPRAVADPQHLPLGGVSDITNRGELDRLLISELAHDDLTLAVRVANNEALYLRREDPPSTPTRQRHIFLDTGIRMWGVPRVLATSAALALLASSESSEALVWTTQHGELVEAKLGDRDGIVEQLSRLDSSLTPAAALQPLFDRISESGQSCADVVIITSSATATDLAFIGQMRGLLPHELYVMGVHRGGEVSLAGVTETGLRPMRQMRLELDDVMNMGVKSRPLIVRDVDPSLPAIFKVSPFPLRVGGRLDPRCVWRVDDGPSLTLTRDGRLLLWNDVARGPLMLQDDLKGFLLHWANTRPWKATNALVGSFSAGEMAHLVIDIHDHLTQRKDLQVSRSHGALRGATVHRDHALFFFRRAITAVELSSGSEVSVQKIGSDIKEMHGRAIRMGRESWHMVSFDGQIRVEELVSGKTPIVIGCFESRELNAPVMLDTRGSLWTVDSPAAQRQIVHVGDGESIWSRLMGVSRDGVRFAVRRRRGGHEVISIFSIAANELREIARDVQDAVVAFEAPAWTQIHDRSRRTKFNGAIVVTTGHSTPQLGLYVRGNEVALTYRDGGIWLDAAANQGSCPFERHPFEPIAGPPNTGYSLSAARWPNGSRIVHDSRGMLHLQSCDSTIPEATFVLAADAFVSGWLSDGRCWGDSYYVEGPRVDAEVVYRTVIERFLRSLA